MGRGTKGWDNRAVYRERKRELTSAEIHDFDFEIFNFRIEFGDLGFQVISFFIDLVAFCVNFPAQISQFIITWK